VAIWKSDFDKRADGRLIPRPSPNETALGVGVYLVDKHGRIRLVTTLSRNDEAIIEDVITSLL
jgi:hypothetical protein